MFELFKHIFKYIFTSISACILTSLLHDFGIEFGSIFELFLVQNRLKMNFYCENDTRIMFVTIKYNFYKKKQNSLERIFHNMWKSAKNGHF